jgi:hypothetical protein
MSCPSIAAAAASAHRSLPVSDLMSETVARSSTPLHPELCEWQ